MKFFLRQTSQALLITQLILGSYPYYGYAEDGGSNERKSLKERAKQATQAISQMQSFIRMGQLQQALSPRKTSHHFFPQCQILSTNVPQTNACQGNPSNPADYQTAAHARNLLQNLRNEFRLDKVERGNIEGSLQGVRCLQDNFDKLKSQLDERLNLIDKSIAELEKFDANFRDDLDKNEHRKIEDIRDELFRGSRNQDFSKIIGSQCQMIMNDNDVRAKSRSTGQQAGGIRGLLDKNNDLFSASQKFSKDQRNIEKNLRANIKFIGQQARNKSLNEFIKSNPDSLLSQNANAKLSQSSALTSGIIAFQQKKSTLFKDLNNTFDKSVGSSDAANALRKELLESGSRRTNIGEAVRRWHFQTQRQCFNRLAAGNLDKSLNRLIDIKEGTSNGGNTPAARGLRTQIKQILNDDNNQSSMDERIRQVQKLFSNFGGNFAIQLTGKICSFNSRQNVTPQDLLSCLQTECNKAGQSIPGMTLNQARKNITQAAKKIQDLETNLGVDLKRELEKATITCEGKQQQVNPTNCTAASFDTTGDFCLNQAKVCGTVSNNCNDHLRNHVDKRTKQAKLQAEKMNGKVRNYEQKMQKMFDGVNRFFERQGKALSDKFGPNLMSPNKLNFTKLSLEQDSDMGFEIYNIDPSQPTAMMEQMRQNLEDMRTKVTEQNAKISQRVQESIDAARDNHNREFREIENEIAKCEEFLNQSSEMISKVNSAQAEACTYINREDLTTHPTLEQLDEVLTALSNPSLRSCLVEYRQQINKQGGIIIQASNICSPKCSYDQPSTNNDENPTQGSYTCNFDDNASNNVCANFMSNQSEPLAKSVLSVFEESDAISLSDDCDQEKIAALCESTKVDEPRAAGKDTTNWGQTALQGLGGLSSILKQWGVTK